MKALTVLACTALLAFPARATEQALLDDAVAKSRAVVGQMIPSIDFVDTKGRVVNLTEYRGQPLLVSLIYTGCADVCPTMIDNLYPAVQAAQQALGKDSFSIVTIGFDTSNDSADRMRSFAREHGIDLPNWDFLAGTAEAVSQLSGATGFTIVPSAGGFEHMAQISIVARQGRIYQQIYGGVFSIPALVEPLKDIVFDRRRPLVSIGGLIDRVKLFCTVYNPNTGRYYFNYSLFVGMAIGITCLLLIGSWLTREFIRSGGSGQDPA